MLPPPFSAMHSEAAEEEDEDEGERDQRKTAVSVLGSDGVCRRKEGSEMAEEEGGVADGRVMRKWAGEECLAIKRLMAPPTE